MRIQLRTLTTQTIFLLFSILSLQAIGDEVSTGILESGYKVEVDGITEEWRTIPSQQLKIVEKTSLKGETDFSVSVQSLYNKDYLYFSITVRDDKFIRTTLAGNGEDKIMLWFGSDAKGAKPIALSFYPADLNGSVGQDLRFGGKKVPAAKAGKKEIEALESFVVKENRWMAEIAIPWEKLSPQLRPLEAIPFCVAAFDGDDKSKPRVEAAAASCSLSKGEPSSLGSLVIEEHRGIIESFLQESKLSRSDIQKEFYIDAGGDAALDRVILAGSTIAILGMGLGQGQYYYYRLTLRSPSDLKDFQLMDIDGNGKQEIVVRSVEYDTKGTYSQEIIRAIGMKNNGAFEPIFGQEVANSQPDGTLTSKFEWKKKGKGYEFIVNQAVSSGVEEKKYVDMDSKDAKDYEEILLPWGSDKKKTYRFSNGKVELAK